MPKMPGVDIRQVVLSDDTKARISTTYKSLDAVIGPGGFRTKAFVAVGGKESMGKSTFTLNLLRNMKCPRLLITLEDDNETVAERYAGNVAPGLYVTDKCRTLQEVVDTIYAASAAGAKVVAVDYIQRIIVPEASDERIGISICSRTLAAASRGANCCIIAATQLNDMAASLGPNADKRPTMSHLYGSRALAKDADVVLLLYSEIYDRPNDTTASDLLEVIIAKQRMGRKGVTVYMDFQRDKFLITEPRKGPQLKDVAAEVAARKQREKTDYSPGVDDAEGWLNG